MLLEPFDVASRFSAPQCIRRTSNFRDSRSELTPSPCRCPRLWCAAALPEKCEAAGQNSNTIQTLYKDYKDRRNLACRGAAGAFGIAGCMGAGGVERLSMPCRPQLCLDTFQLISTPPLQGFKADCRIAGLSLSLSSSLRRSTLQIRTCPRPQQRSHPSMMHSAADNRCGSRRRWRGQNRTLLRGLDKWQKQEAPHSGEPSS